jgi:hypothetical protein
MSIFTKNQHLQMAAFHQIYADLADRIENRTNSLEFALGMLTVMQQMVEANLEREREQLSSLLKQWGDR